jgi:hypothetical protein
MSTRQENRAQLISILDEPLDETRLADFLLRESKLPGPRANLELASDFALAASERTDGRELLPLFARWLGGERPDHPAAEYLPFCALYGLGGLYLGASSSDRAAIVELLRASANSESWRLREAVTLALQFVGVREAEEMMQILRLWLEDSTIYDLRAVICTLAHPPILTVHSELADECFLIADRIVTNIGSPNPNPRRQERLKVLEKGMGFALSVLVAAFPEVGFEFMRRWAGVRDDKISRVLRANLKKDRLANRYPEETSQIAALLNGDRR